ncbi:sensor histidine kinase [Oerskovia sp. NPDC057915]|uniref:sensor histidine kinase n=1 Tax=Oerskovia sp. NPDC057915 TaxID=3346280 RepID=UPI0036D9DF69
MSSPRSAAAAVPVGDVVAIAVVVLFGVLPFPDEDFRTRGLLVLIALVPAAVMPLRRRRPIVSLGVSVVCTVAVALAGTMAPGALVAVMITAFSVANRTRRTVGLACVGVAALVVFLVSAVPFDGEYFDPGATQFVTLVVLAGAMGDATRSRREALAAVTERAERAEQGRDEEARRRVVEERVRIARDLHDVVAHQISVISLSAGVASSSLETRPERAREALTTIRSASRTVLADIGGLMALLRAEGGGERQDLHPQAGLDQLDALVARFADVGLHVDVRREPGSGALSPASDHVAYLALQEGLTNAHKHGAGDRAVVDVRLRDGMLVLMVTSPLRAGAAEVPASGHGLRGLRERVASVRGRVGTTSEDGEFRLVIEVPAERTPVPAPSEAQR